MTVEGTAAMTATPGLVPSTTPYPWPWDGSLSFDRLAVVVAGWDPGWMGRTDPGQAVLGNVMELASAVPVVAVVAHDVRSPRFPAHPAGPTPPALGGATLVAGGVDAFYGSSLDALLRASGRDQLLVVGLGLEGPVHSTMRSANDRGYECLLVLDACAPLDPSLDVASRSMVEMSGGIFGAVGQTQAVLDALSLLAPGGTS